MLAARVHPCMTSAAVIAETSAVRGVDETYAAFAHLNAPNAPLYRAILATFVAERARFVLALRPSEILPALAATSTVRGSRSHAVSSWISS